MDGNISDFGSNVSTSHSRRKNTGPPATEAPRPDPDDEMRARMVQWMWEGDAYSAAPNTYDTLEPGMYSLEQRQGRIAFLPKQVKIDDLLRFPCSKSDKILKEIEEFWARHANFTKYGVLHRRGYLFYGPAGSGKTALVQLIVADIIKQGGTVFLCDQPQLLNKGLSVFRQVEKERKIVCLFEDIDAIISSHGEDELLSLLDGENQVDQVLNIATTNYPERLDKRIVARPRRFDRIVLIKMPNAAIRREYFFKKLKVEADELERWVKATAKFSFAACAELLISVKCLGHDFDESVQVLRALLEEKRSSKDYELDQNMGFGTKINIEEDDEDMEEILTTAEK